jgi:hypothetical protein
MAAKKLSPGDSDWMTFEKDVAAFVEALDPSCVVTHDVKRLGFASGRKRQMDVVVTGTLGVSKIEVAIECKRNATKTLTIKHIDEFVGKVLDFGADRGVLCAFGGFGAGAVARATGALHPKIELRDLSHWSLLSPWGEIADDFMRDDCPNESCWGEVAWGEFPSEDGKTVKAGYCHSCGSLIAECAQCGEKTSLEFDDMKCDGCASEWHVLRGGGSDSFEAESVTWTAGPEDES